MGKNRLFVPQDVLDQWIDASMAFVEANELTLADESHIYHLAPAVCFLRESTGEPDPHDLVGRVKEDTQLTILGAEPYMDSVILEDNAYDVRRGFVAVPALEASHGTSLRTQAERASQIPVPVVASSESSDEDIDPALMETLSDAQLDIIDEPPIGSRTKTEPPPPAVQVAPGEPDPPSKEDEDEGDELAKLLLKSLK